MTSRGVGYLKRLPALQQLRIPETARLPECHDNALVALARLPSLLELDLSRVAVKSQSLLAPLEKASLKKQRVQIL